MALLLNHYDNLLLQPATDRREGDAVVLVMRLDVVRALGREI